MEKVEVNSVAVLGAGRTGREIALLAAGAGYTVTLLESSPSSAATALYGIEALLKERDADAYALKLKQMRIKVGSGLEVLAQCPLVIEAVPENYASKARLVKRLDQILPESSIIASTSSTLLISKLAAQTKRKDRVIGLHFLTPVLDSELVEVVPSALSSTQTIDTCIGFVRAIGKQPLRVAECTGFVVNRITAPYLQAAFKLWETRTASVAQIDKLLVKFGFPQGPFQWIDAVGVDHIYQLFRSLYKSYGPRFSPPELLLQMITAGRLGRKTQGGFYREGRAADKELRELAGTGGSGDFDNNEGVELLPEFLLFPMVNEAAACLQEGIAYPDEIDYAIKAGIGFPAALGGPLRYADSYGIERVYRGLRDMSRVDSVKFWPHYLLQVMTAAGMLGVKTGSGFYHYGKASKGCEFSGRVQRDRFVFDRDGVKTTS